MAADIGVTIRTNQKWVTALEMHGDDAFPGKGNWHVADEELWKQKKRIKKEIKENGVIAI